jgi:putative transposase
LACAFICQATGNVFQFLVTGSGQTLKSALMHFEPNQVYHVYNRGNNKQRIFFTDANYIYLLQKIKTEWKKYADILCYCLMPNHFHFMIRPNEAGCQQLVLAGNVSSLQNLSKTIGKTLSSYTAAINIQNKTTGNLFQKKTKAKLLTQPGKLNEKYITQDYLLTCFYYIHQNPLKAKLVKHLKNWRYSSFPDYYGYRNGILCNKDITIELLSLSKKDFIDNKELHLNDAIVELLF